MYISLYDLKNSHIIFKFLNKKVIYNYSSTVGLKNKCLISGNTTTKDRGDQISYTTAKMVIENSLPFSLVKSPYFIEMVQS